MASLGILLMSSPEDENTHTAIKIAEAARAKGIVVRIFLMCDGVYHVNTPPFLSLLEKKTGSVQREADIEVSLCAYNADQRGLPMNERSSILYGSQDDLASIVNETDRFIALT